jgi:siroheme synthase-like protein
MLMLAVDLQGRLAVVVGGGPVAERKARVLLEAGARVRVISPGFTDGLRALAAAGRVEAAERAYQAGDAAGAALVVAAAGDPAVDGAVAAEVKAAGGLVSVSGQPGLGNVHFTAEVRRGPIRIGIATGGASPALARRLKAAVGRAVGPAYGELAELLAEARGRLRAQPGISQAERARVYTGLVKGPLLDLLAAGDRAQARAVLEAALQEARRGEGS